MMRIANFAHGSFFMLGAFLAYQLAPRAAGGVIPFLLLMVCAALLTALFGVLVEFLVLRRLYGAPVLATMLATFVLLLLLQGGVQLIWGVTPHAVAAPEQLRSSVAIAGLTVPTYHLVVIVVGVVSMMTLYVLIYRTPFGRLVRAVAHDRRTAAALGVPVVRTFAAMFAVGIGLAGLAGALQAPLITIDSNIGADYVIDAFAVVVIGGLGSLSGTTLAAVAIGLFNSFTVVYAPEIASYSLYLVLIVVLLLRPAGLAGKGAASESFL
jgi:branched-subunit amino acid ABC-type transport system permease component